MTPNDNCYVDAFFYYIIVKLPVNFNGGMKLFLFFFFCNQWVKLRIGNIKLDETILCFCEKINKFKSSFIKKCFHKKNTKQSNLLFNSSFQQSSAI